MKKVNLLFAGLILTVITVAQSYNFDQAVEAYNAKDFDKALDFLNRDLADNPKSVGSYCYRALVYAKTGNNAEALSSINNAIRFQLRKDKLSNAYNYYIRAMIYGEIEDAQKAIADLTMSIKLAPDDPEYLIERAALYVAAEEYEKGEADFRSALKIDESYVDAWLGIGRSYFIQQRYDDADKALTKLIKLSPEYPIGYYYKARVDFALKKYDAAIEGMFFVLTLDNESVLARKLFLTFASQNLPLALSNLNSQIIATPQQEFWYLLRTSVLEENKDYLLAIADYNKVMELSDDFPKSGILGYRAACYNELGNFSQAIADYNQALSLDSSNAYHFANRANVKRVIGDYAGAVADFTKAIAIQPNEAWFYSRRGWVKDEFMKDTQGGLRDYNQAIAVDKNAVYTYLHRGRLYEKSLNDAVRANADYEMILTLDTVLHPSGNSRHYALFHLGRVIDAISWSNKIIETYPTEGNYYDAACMYSLMKKPAESIANLKLAFENGFASFVHLSKDDDLDNVRNTPEFKALVQEWKNKNEKIATKMAVEKVTKKEPELMVVEPETAILPMKNISSGTYEIKCQINGLPLNFLFDTGASDISISQTEVDFMLKNGYLDKADVLGAQKFQYANGDIEVGTKILLRKVNLGGFILRNVTASVVLNTKAPLLIGQSALGKYGKIIIDNDKKTITISRKK